VHKWEDNIKMDFKEWKYENMDRIHLGQNRVQWQPLMNIEINVFGGHKS
jgi:hypothetical protein